MQPPDSSTIFDKLAVHSTPAYPSSRTVQYAHATVSASWPPPIPPTSPFLHLRPPKAPNVYMAPISRDFKPHYFTSPPRNPPRDPGPFHVCRRSCLGRVAARRWLRRPLWCSGLITTPGQPEHKIALRRTLRRTITLSTNPVVARGLARSRFHATPS